MPFLSSDHLRDRLARSPRLWQGVVEQAQRHSLPEGASEALASPDTFVQWLDKHECRLVASPSGRGSAAFAPGSLPPLSTTVPRILAAQDFDREFPGFSGHFVS